MYCWKMAKNLMEPQDPDWEKLVSNELGEKIHPNRKMGFLLSRAALRSCFASKGLLIPITELRVQNYSIFTEYPNYTFSLSHTKNIGVAILGCKKEYLSLGIDVEQLNREVKDSIIEKIKNPGDAKLRKIHHWCLKEAVFKTLMNSKQFVSPLEFSSILLSNNQWSHPSSGLRGGWDLEEIGSLIIAKAYLRS